jgi:predicted alpha/beta superfamily hydrolase
VSRVAAAVALALGAALAPPAAAAQAAPPVAGPPLGMTGTIRYYHDVASRYVAARDVEVWLPPGYAHDTAARYPVLYVQDGQNVFDPATSYTHVDWGVDETMTRLIAERAVRPAIVVAIWNTARRFQEYMPQRALGPDSTFASGVPGLPPVPGPALSDAYLRFMVEELKPFVDSAYRTLPGPADTFVMGSSMGGLIAAYAVTQYPQVFGGAACLSTHWPAADGAFVPYFARSLPPPASHRFYFDHGTATLDSLYAPGQRRVDEAMRAAGYVAGLNWISRVIPGADHSERSWRVRLAQPLIFLLGR